MKFRNNEKGITLISLIITIIIILLLTAVSLSGTFGGGNVIERAQEAIYKSDVKDLKDLWESKIADIDASNINFDSLEDAIGESQVPREFRGIFAIENGRLVYLDGVLDAEKEQWMNDVGIFKMFMNMIQIDIMASVKSISQSEIIKTKPVDVILVLDASSSMKETSADGSVRYKNLVPAVNGIMKLILEADPANRIGIVQFYSTYKNLLSLQHYTISNGEDYITTGSSKGVFNSYLTPPKTNDYQLVSGTNVQIGIARAEQMFKQRSESEKKDRLDYMIVLSDGEATTYGTNVTYDKITASSMPDMKTSGNNAAAYETIMTLEDIAKKHEGLKIYTINYTKNNVRSYAVMEPNETNITNYVNKLSSSEKNKYSNIKNMLPFSYPTAAFSGEFTADELSGIFEQIGNSILEDQVQETKIDTVEKATTLVIDESMRYKDEENNQEVIFKLDLGGEVKVRLTAGVFVPTGEKTEDDKIIREVDPSRTVKYEKTYSVVDIQNGIDPNLMISGGSVIWNVASDFSTKEELQSTAVRTKAINEARSKFTYNEAADEAIDISKVEIVVPVYQAEVIPLGGK